jgi:hypothetical protein
MPTGGVYERVPVKDIVLDTSNPRIAHYLEHQQHPPTLEMIELALETGGDDDRAGTSFSRLKQSILTNRGVSQPVILHKQSDGKYRCVEGNTRVFLYGEFKKDGVEGDWEEIPAVVHEAVSATDLHSIRLQAHLVGPRPWDAYSKAKYLHHLRNQEQLPLSELVDLCGGNKRDIVESLDAYEDMEEYYRPIVKDEGFETRRFSGFVELQNPTVKRALSDAGYTKSDFAGWIHAGKFKSLASIRSLPLVLVHEKARKAFLEEGMEKALKMLDRPQLNQSLEGADLEALSRALQQAVGTLPFDEFCRLKDDPSLPTVQHLITARDAISNLMSRLDLEE